MSEFPECLEPRMNGQRCHRIAGHKDYSDCIFDRPAEFEPPIREARPLKARPLDRLSLKLAEA